ncbi:hypothetical protein LTR94_035959, partial [Friedmanniomyces endolithicus]
MLAAIGQLLNVLAGRLARVIDRARALELMIHKVDHGPDLMRHKWELRLLDRRMSIINAALLMAVSSAVMAGCSGQRASLMRRSIGTAARPIALAT